MYISDICPLCGGKKCERFPIDSDDDWCNDEKGFRLKCSNEVQCIIHSSIYSGEEDDVVKRFHMIDIFLVNYYNKELNGIGYNYYKELFGIRHKFLYKFYYDEKTVNEIIDDPHKINVATLLKEYPKTFMEKMDMAILNLSKKFPNYGTPIVPRGNIKNLLYCRGIEDNAWKSEIVGILVILEELGYLKEVKSYIYVISADGWKKISEMEQNKSMKQAFIAMSFSEETNSISTSFKNAISKCGYMPRRIDEKEHNRQIVPEILFEISRSQFVVVDITHPNYGAYYEAGYAEALGKEVIICCRDTVFNGENKPHFDIAQKSTVVWSDETELEERLYKRIEATVGLNI